MDLQRKFEISELLSVLVLVNGLNFKVSILGVSAVSLVLDKIIGFYLKNY